MVPIRNEIKLVFCKLISPRTDTIRIEKANETEIASIAIPQQA